MLPALLGKSAKGRDYHVINSTGKALAIRHGKWKFIPAGVAIRDGINGASAKMSKSPEGGSLFDLEKDPKELDNVASQHPDICEQMKAKLEEIRQRPETKGLITIMVSLTVMICILLLLSNLLLMRFLEKDTL